MRESLIKSNDRGVFFELRHTEKFPFSLESFLRAIGGGIPFTHSTLGKVNEDTILSAFTEVGSDGRVTMTRKTAMRRILSPNRVILVWNAVVELEGALSVRLKEEGWAIAECKVFTAASASNPEVKCTVVRNVTRITPLIHDAIPVEEQRRRVDEMNDLVFDAFRWLITLGYQSIENAVLAETRAPHLG